METTQHNTITQTGRECGMMVAVATQGTGKTHQNKILICKYVKDNLETKVRGRKTLILDTNGEFPSSEFGKNGIPALSVKLLAVKDVKAWCLSPFVEARRIDMKSLSIDQKMEVLNYVCQVVRNCLLVLEDINTIVLDITHMKNVVSSLVNLRHKAVDVIVSYQSLRAVEPRILANCRYVRMHYLTEDVDNVKGKLGEPEVFKIAQFIVNQKYFTGNKRFFLYVHTNPHKIEGAFNKNDFKSACAKYLQINKKRLRDEMDITGCSMAQAIENQSEQMFQQYYANADKD